MRAPPPIFLHLFTHISLPPPSLPSPPLTSPPQYPTHHLPHAGREQATLPSVSNLPQNLQILPALTTPAQEDAENTPNITQLLAELQPPRLPAHIPEKPAAQQVFLGHGLPPLPKALVDRILAGCYIDFADLPPAKGKIRPLPAPEGSVILVNTYEYLQQRRLIPDLATWLQCCALYTAVICSRNPGRLTDLLGYMAQIAKASQRFKWPSWVIYDLNFRQEAASRDSTDWAHLDPSLFAQCFTGQAKQNEAWCKVCHSLDHSSDQCPIAPPPTKRPKSTTNHPSPTPRLSYEVCRRYNRGVCTGEKCRYRHCCSKCHVPPSQARTGQPCHNQLTKPIAS